MIAKPKLTFDELTVRTSTARAPAFVSKWTMRPGGVDPLGLRQVNFDLMDRALPGLNNAATRLRPYVLITWAWWKAFELFEQRGGRIELDRLKGFVDRIEVLFVASHVQARQTTGLLGAQVLTNYRKGADHYVCTGPRWDAFRKKRGNTSLMAPVAYGPSIRAGGTGLAFLRANDNGVLRPMAEVMPAVHAFDKAIRKIADHPALATLEGADVSLEALEGFHPRWRTDALTKAEREVGWRRLHGDPIAEARRPMLDLILKYLATRRRPINVNELRQALARRGRGKPRDNDSPSARAIWRSLQTQQLYRFAVEALLVWVLQTIGTRPASLADLRTRLLEAVRGEADQAFGAWLLDDPLEDLGFDPVVDPVAMIDQIGGWDEAWVSDALDGLRAALRIAKAEGKGSELFRGQADRLPLARALQRMALIADLPVSEALEVFLSEWLIGQHIYWAVGRSGDETQRLRLCLEETGWTAITPRPSYPNPTPDRLETVLRLMADMGRVERTADDLYSVST